MIITKHSLPRRTFLRGVGASLALPLLDGMVPAFAAVRGSAAKPVPRLFTGYVPNGVIMDQWTPAAEGALTDLPATLQPLAPFKDKLLIVSGLADAPAFPLPGEGTGDHVRAAATFLTPPACTQRSPPAGTSAAARRWTRSRPACSARRPSSPRWSSPSIRTS